MEKHEVKNWTDVLVDIRDGLSMSNADLARIWSIEPKSVWGKIKENAVSAQNLIDIVAAFEKGRFVLFANSRTQLQTCIIQIEYERNNHETYELFHREYELKFV